MIAALASLSGARVATAEPQPHTVTIDAVKFEPARLVVHRGDTITWVNRDPFPHTATSAAGGFDSKSIDPGKSWRWTAAKTGTFDYVCTFHPTMKATIVVE